MKPVQMHSTHEYLEAPDSRRVRVEHCLVMRDAKGTQRTPCHTNRVTVRGMLFARLNPATSSAASIIQLSS
jgi:hypothetical protein